LVPKEQSRRGHQLRTAFVVPSHALSQHQRSGLQPPPSIAEPKSVDVGETATELEPEVEEIQEDVIYVDLSEDEPEPDEEVEEIPNITMGAIEMVGGRPRGPEVPEVIDETWNAESVNLVSSLPMQIRLSSSRLARILTSPLFHLCRSLTRGHGSNKSAFH